LHKTSAEIADFLQGELEGDSAVVITGVAGLREAQSGQISFLEHSRYLGLLSSTAASVVLVGREIEVPKGKTVIRVSHPSSAFGKIVALISPKPIRYEPGVHAKAHVHSSASIDPSASIQPFAVIEAGVRIGARTVVGSGCHIGLESVVGADCLLYSNVAIRERCVIGNRVILHPGVVIGSDGFGYEFLEGQYKKIPQVGIVQLDDDVEMGSNSCVDRGRFGKTWIQKGVKIDNLVQIGHNVIVGEHTAMAAQAGISGSTVIGHHVRIGGQVGTVGHITVGDEAILGAQSGVNHDVPKGKFVFGYPAQEHKEAMKTHANIRRLPYLNERIRKLEKRLNDLDNKS
jgi:UDP-3-O-[3-hydroxymyristoyl] glucosamine N-acyltransferase